MKYVIFGLPGSGKGLYSNYIEQITGAKQLSTGDLLRKMKHEDQGKIGEELRSLSPTDFASDEIIIEAIKTELKNEKYANGVIFDGFPRTLTQAEKMIELGIYPDAIISVECPEEVIIKRIEGRRVHPSSGRVYHITNKPPKNEGLDDVTGEPLIIRDDDKPEFLAQRFKDFNEKTKPAFEFLKSKCKNGSGPVFAKISGELSQQEAKNELAVTTGSIKAIHKIRETHSFTLIVFPYDHTDSKNENIVLREIMHQSLMRGEVPFSPEIFYYQKNMLDPKNEEHQLLIQQITEHILAKSDKLLIAAKKDNNPLDNLIGGKLNGENVFISESNLQLASEAKRMGKMVEFVNSSLLTPQCNDFYDPSNRFLNVSDFLKHREVLDKLISNNPLSKTKKENERTEFVIIESPYAGNTQEILRNENYARVAALDCLNKGEIPFASHILYTQKGILEDKKSAQRRLGIEAGLKFGELCSKSVLYSDLGMTEGMIEGVENAKKLGRNTEIRKLSDFELIYNAEIKKQKKGLKP